MKNIEIISTGRAVPSKVVTNDDLAKIVDTNDEWISTRTGIRERRFCSEEESATTLAVEAARKALEASQLAPSDIGACICATISGDYATPSMACLVQRELGLREPIPTLDVNAACSGFLYGIEVARGLLNGCGEKYALVVGCEQLSKLLDMTDRSTCVLFGDGAGAAVVRLSEDATYASTLGARGGFEINVEGAGHGTSHIHMQGQEVFKFATSIIPVCIRQLQEKSGLSVEDVSRVVCHQANERIIDSVVRRMKADPGKFYKNMDRFGNTSAASVPIALDELVENGDVKAGDMLMMVGFGAGLTWAGAVIRYAGV
ncbi:beta-ketoacyl-ACP synthase III [Butyrivibrio sp. WCD2001]|uniref:beta-ketoacyl-ACP synthase III n=1 Tax=Butyrivibrio sp. WCD2001 TaxID=1280681 RepID=UPI00041E1192|nr:beta-ketoacyl-ACP synthase III [Butyrivibrio sp. WCD2001]